MTKAFNMLTVCFLGFLAIMAFQILQTSLNQDPQASTIGSRVFEIYPDESDNLKKQRLDIAGRIDKYKALTPAQQRDGKSFQAALTHRMTWEEILVAGKSILPEILSDHQIRTQNNQGLNWGYHPAMAAGVDASVRGSEPKTLVEIGSAYGPDDLALIRNHPNLKVITLDPGAAHVGIQNKLAQVYLSPSEQSRLTSYVGSFPQNAALIKDNSADVVVISAVLHFYKDEEIVTFLKTLESKVKPGGRVLITNLSDHLSLLTQILTSVFGNWAPYLYGSDGKLLGFIPYGWQNFMNPDQVRRLVKDTGFEVESSQYVGIINDKEGQRWWWIGGLNLEEAMNYTVLKKPN